MQSSFKLQQAIKAILEAHKPKIKVTQEVNTGRSLSVTIKSQTIKLPLENNRQYSKAVGSFR